MADITQYPIEGSGALFSTGGGGNINYTGELVDDGVVIATTTADGNLTVPGKFVGDLSGTATSATTAVNADTTTALATGDYYFNTDGNIKCSDVEVTGMTPARAVIANSSGKLETHSGVTSTELGYLNGVTSNIQDQLDNASSGSSGSSSTFYEVKTAGFTSNSSVNWIPWNGNIESSNFGGPTNYLEYCTFIAPYNGVVTKLLFRCESTLSHTFIPEISASFFKAETNTEVPVHAGQVGSTIIRSSTLADDTTVTFNNTESSGWDISAGKLYALRLWLSDSPVDSTVTMVIKYTI